MSEVVATTDLKILIWGLPTMTREILQKILSGKPEWKVAALNAEDGALPDAIHRFQPDVIVVPPTRTDVDPACESFMMRCTRRRVLRLSSVGREVCVHNLRPVTFSIGNVSEKDLLDAIEGVGPENRDP